MQPPPRTRPRIGLLVTLATLAMIIGMWTQRTQNAALQPSPPPGYELRHDATFEVSLELLADPETGRRTQLEGQLGFAYRIPENGLATARATIAANWQDAGSKLLELLAGYSRADIVHQSEVVQAALLSALAEILLPDETGEVTRVGWELLALRRPN